jgi:AAA15 family ATPase/GTPase
MNDERTFLSKITLKNFKRFSELDIPITDGKLVIYGPNNCGKTQILWAIILFCRGYNLDTNNDHYGKNISSEIGRLINRPALDSLSDFKSFVNKLTENENYGNALITGYFTNQDACYDVKLYSNGSLQISRDPLRKLDTQKIRFSFMGSEFHFAFREVLLTVDSIRNSSEQIFRQLYHNLTERSKENILRFLNDLFKIKDINDEQMMGKLYVIDHLDLRTEVMFSGSAIQKVFGTFILLFWLIECKENVKVFLMEEPEAILYPSIVQKFIQTIQELCTQHTVTLIVTSNSQYVLDNFKQENRFGLSNEFGASIEDESECLKLIGYIKTVSSKKTIIVDGPDDSKFLNKYIKKSILDNLSVFTHHGFQLNKVCQIQFVSKSSCNNLIFLRYPEFMIETKIKEFENSCLPAVAIIHHDLPCIESYFLLDYFILSSADANFRKKLLKYFSCCRHAAEFSNGFTSSNSIVSIVKTMDEVTSDEIDNLWSDAVKELNKKDCDWLKVVKVIKGHSGLKELMGFRDTTINMFSKHKL